MTQAASGFKAKRSRRGLRYGFSTGACATAATRAAVSALFGRGFPDPVEIRLPRGQRVTFPLAEHGIDAEFAHAAVTKDAGDDPDVTHGCLVRVAVRRAAPGSGVLFRAGPGVGTVTLPGLPLPPGEPAINPVPRQMMREVVQELAAACGERPDVEITVSIPGGEELARRTWNPRLGILGGLSILGTTGIVKPYSCSAWIASIRRGIDVARAAGLDHVAAATGRISEGAVRALYGLPDTAIIDMGDFVGGMLKYLRRHPLPRLSIAGGFGKLAKLAQGALDLHSARSQLRFDLLARRAAELGADAALTAAIAAANTARAALEAAHAGGIPLADAIAADARRTALSQVEGRIAIEVLIVDREGRIVGRAAGW